MKLYFYILDTGSSPKGLYVKECEAEEKPKTFEEVKAWFEPNAELEEEHSRWTEIEDIDDMREYLIWEAQGMRPNYRIEDCPD